MPDLETLDEQAIRLDVRNAIDQGFFSTAVTSVWWDQDDPRWARLGEIVLDEARGEILVMGTVGSDDVDRDIAAIRQCEKMGFTHLGLFPVHCGISQEDLYHAYRRRIEATDLPVSVYAGQSRGFVFPGMGPSGVPLDVLDRIADLPNVVAMKLTQPLCLTTTYAICERIADRILIGPVNLDFVSTLGRTFQIQWSGQWNAESLQVPSNQLACRYVNAVAEKNFNRALEIYREMQPVLDLFYEIQAPLIKGGGHPWQHNKYYAWLGGANGGLLPAFGYAEEQMPTLDAATRQRIRDAFAASGLLPTEAPDEQFVVGRAAWNRGVRARDMVFTPRWTD